MDNMLKNNKKLIKGYNDFATLYPKMLVEWDYEKNDRLGLKPDEMLVGSQKKVNWICSKGHSFERSIYDRLNGRGHCPYCSNRKVLKGFNDLATTNPELLKEWNYDKNEKLGIRPDEITNGGKTKVWWKCKKGHEWNSIIRSRITGSGCPYCSNNLVLKGYNDITTTNPELLNEWNYEKNDKLGIKPSDLSHGSTKEVWWKCSKGHEYKTTVAQKTNRNVKCPICANRLSLAGYNDFATKHPELLNEWNYEKNDKLGIKPNEIIRSGKTKVWWKCKKGHEWQSTVSSRIRDKRLYHECPACMSYRKISLPEKIIYYYLKKAFSDTIANYKPLWLNNKEIDIYIPSKKVGIEYDGAYYHKDYERDLLKDELCKSNGVTLIRIREKNTPKIKSTSIIFKLLDNNKSDGSHVKSGIEFLEKYFRISLNYDLNRDIDEILELINFIEKYNCIANRNPEVLNEWDYDRNNELGITPNNVSAGSSIKVWWKCEKGHHYKATISTKINQSTGCPYCSSKCVLVGFNDLATTNPELLKEWDYNKNIIKPDEVVKGYTKKVWWKCEKGHSYDMLIINRINGNGCPYCSGHKVLAGFNDVATTNPELLKEWDYNKNMKLGYYMNQFTKGNATKVWWKCEKGHSYLATINSRTSPKKTHCPYCSGNKVLAGFNDVATTNPELLKEWDYSQNVIKPTEITNGTHNKIWWICQKGHSYQSTIPSRRRGTNCPYCSGNKVLAGFNDVATTNPEILKSWDYIKNEKDGITPNNVSKSYSKKVWWKCEKGHSYQREIYNQRNGYGKCPICKKNK